MGKSAYTRSIYRCSPLGKKQSRESVRRHTWKAKLACLRHYGGNPPKCACCGEDNIGFLTLDHVNNDGHAHRQDACAGSGSGMYLFLKRNGFPNDPPIQVLCYNCNCGRERNGGTCPHKKPMTEEGLRHVDRRRRAPSQAMPLYTEACHE